MGDILVKKCHFGCNYGEFEVKISAFWGVLKGPISLYLATFDAAFLAQASNRQIPVSGV